MKASMRSRQEPRRVSNGVIIAAMLLSLCVLSIVKARYCSTPFGPGKPEDQLQEQMNSSIRMETDDERVPAVNTAQEEEEEDVEEDTGPATKEAAPAEVAANTGSGAGKKDNKSASKKKKKPTCFMTSKRSERCEVAGDIRVVGNASTIYISGLDREWTTKPYARYHDPVAMSHVREFTLKPLPSGAAAPACTKNHSVPGFVFSNRGFSGNLYHDYTDVLFPLFLSTRKFKGDVQFLLSDLKPWWVAKFRPLFRQLSKYDVVDVNNDLETHCFPRIVVGSDFHKDMGIIPSKAAGHVSTADFKRVLRNAFGLERAAASRGGATGDGKPRLLIISRKNSRRFLNEREMAAAAAEEGFEVRIAEPDQHTDMATFARLVNSADAMIGVHGAGLTNMVFLPAGAVLVQVVPFGGLEWLTRVTFKEPAADMEVRYMDYNVQLEESSLLDQYPRGHQVLVDPYAVHKQGWDALKAAYLDKQNVRLDLDRFRATLREVLAALPPAPTSTTPAT
ncbi:alpha-1,3-arabinosyltransferase XAT2 [Lolium perenne]|uniref:alpha-1,3-arabinosyltransferase XAT2 n=1 Tax=Lolium perenne TaxID=4522 RepID=UPI0021EB0C7F|nr:alpha-1,3-arabinosyltransferase XAT2-like [Lolium perenne]